MRFSFNSATPNTYCAADRRIRRLCPSAVREKSSASCVTLSKLFWSLSRSKRGWRSTQVINELPSFLHVNVERAFKASSSEGVSVMRSCGFTSVSDRKSVVYGKRGGLGG